MGHCVHNETRDVDDVDRNFRASNAFLFFVYFSWLFSCICHEVFCMPADSSELLPSGNSVCVLVSVDRYEKTYDDYSIIMVKALADRLAEVFQHCIHSTSCHNIALSVDCVMVDVEADRQIDRPTERDTDSHRD